MLEIQEFKQRYCGLRLPWFDYLCHSLSYEFFMSRLTELCIEVHSVMTPHSQTSSLSQRVVLFESSADQVS